MAYLDLKTVSKPNLNAYKLHQYQSEAPRLQSSLCRHHDITLLAEFSGNCAVARIGKTYPIGKVITA